jgi:hypothetical protein
LFDLLGSEINRLGSHRGGFRLCGDVSALGPPDPELATSRVERVNRRADGLGDLSGLGARKLHRANLGDDFRRENPKRHLAHDELTVWIYAATNDATMIRLLYMGATFKDFKSATLLSSFVARVGDHDRSRVTICVCGPLRKICSV